MTTIATRAAGLFTELCKPMNTTMAGRALGAAPLVSLLALTGITYATAESRVPKSEGGREAPFHEFRHSRTPFYGKVNLPLKTSLIIGAVASPLAIAGIAKLGAILSTKVEFVRSALAHPMAAKAIEVLPGAARITALVLGVFGVVKAFKDHGCTNTKVFTQPKQTLVRNKQTGNLPLVTILTAITALVSPVTRSVANYAIPNIISRVA